MSLPDQVKALNPPDIGRKCTCERTTALQATLSCDCVWLLGASPRSMSSCYGYSLDYVMLQIVMQAIT